MGAISVGANPDLKVFDLRDIRMIEMFSQQAAIAIHNARLYTEVLELQKEKINSEKENFELAINTQLQGAKSNLEKLENLLISDQEILYWMEKLNNNKTQVAKQLGVTHRTILRRTKSLYH